MPIACPIPHRDIQHTSILTHTSIAMLKGWLRTTTGRTTISTSTTIIMFTITTTVPLTKDSRDPVAATLLRWQACLLTRVLGLLYKR